MNRARCRRAAARRRPPARHPTAPRRSAHRAGHRGRRPGPDQSPLAAQQPGRPSRAIRTRPVQPPTRDAPSRPPHAQQRRTPQRRRSPRFRRGASRTESGPARHRLPGHPNQLCRRANPSRGRLQHHHRSHDRGLEVVNIWSAEHSYIPHRGGLTRIDQSPWVQYVDVGAGRRCYRVLAYNSAGDGPLSAVTCAAPPGGREPGIRRSVSRRMCGRGPRVCWRSPGGRCADEMIAGAAGGCRRSWVSSG